MNRQLTTREPKVRVESRRAAKDASRAAERVKRVGVAKALSDKRVARDLRRATEHASKAASLAVAQRRRRVGTTAVLVVGTGALAGAAYGGWRKYSGSPESADAGETLDAPVTDRDESDATTPDAAGEDATTTGDG
jgi:hypothetical protein